MGGGGGGVTGNPSLRLSEILEPDHEMLVLISYALDILCFDSLRPSRQFFSHVGTGLPGFNQY